MKHLLFLAASTALFSAPSFAEDTHNHKGQHTYHAPIGVMGDHVHNEGEWMMSYRYSSMKMKGNLNGSRSVTPNEVLNDFMVTPTNMTMEMHMFGLMYGVNDHFTLMGMAPYITKSMDHINRMNTYFTTETKGLGDIKLSSLYMLYNGNTYNIHLNAGISLPTGSIDKRDNTPAGNNVLPYAMQLGSGTYDVLPSITINGHNEAWSWGGQLSAIIRLDENNRDYRLGNEYKLTTWGTHQVTESMSTSVRVDASTWGNISGADTSLNPMMVPTARTDLRRGSRIDLSLGLDYQPYALEGQRFSVEFGMPVYQHLDGPQMEVEHRLTAGWTLSF